MSLESPNTNVIHRTGGYSAAVEIELLMDNRSFSVAQVGRGVLILEEAATLPSHHGELVLKVDGNPRRWRVTIENPAVRSRSFQAHFDELTG